MKKKTFLCLDCRQTFKVPSVSLKYARRIKCPFCQSVMVREVKQRKK